MVESLYRFAESAVALDNVLYSVTISIAVAAILGQCTRGIKRSLSLQVVSSVLFQVLVIILYFAVRDEVQGFRLSTISERLASLRVDAPCHPNEHQITNWRDGLEAIARCPTEVGNYLVTADKLAADRDYESAATLLEMGTDFIQISPLPLPICERLQAYYVHLTRRPRLTKDCTKIHVL